MTAGNPFFKINFRLAACLLFSLLLGFMPWKAPEDYESTDLAPFRKTGRSVQFIRLDKPPVV